MTNKFGIPEEVEQEIRTRDRRCVYCYKVMVKWSIRNTKDDATIEHLREEGPFYWKSHPKADPNKVLKKEDLVICCRSCNSSRGKKSLDEWFNSSYCIDGKVKISKNTVALPVKNFLRKYKNNVI